MSAVMVRDSVRPCARHDGRANDEGAGMAGGIRVAMVGCGATGTEVARAIAGREGVEVVAAIDTDPAKAGAVLGDGLPEVAADLEAAAGADVAVVTVGSTITSVTPVLEAVTAAGMDAVSLCEELAFPWFDDPEGARRLHAHAERHGASILATGANPGFLMDTLPIVLSAGLRTVRRVTIDRTTDLSAYGPLLGKFGFGLTPGEHAAAADVVGHIGFRQSIAHLAHALGLQLEAIEVDAPVPIVVAERERRGAILRVPAGGVAVVRHAARGIVAGEAAIACTAVFGFLADGDPVRRGDTWRLEGDGRVVELASPTGFDSWETTIAVLVNSIGALPALAPGLRTTSDLPVGALAAKGRRLLPAGRGG
jgi:2,4-diaminopentanoate dehydrogenase